EERRGGAGARPRRVQELPRHGRSAEGGPPPMRLRLPVTANAASADGAKPPPQELKLDGDAIVIGRDKGSTVVLAEPSVSRNHAKITREGSLYFVEDVGSAFG